jgi:hypothetical protein
MAKIIGYPVHLIKIVRIENHTDITRLFLVSFLSEIVPKPQKFRNIFDYLPGHQRWDHAGSDIPRFLVRKRKIVVKSAGDLPSENRGTGIRIIF